MAIARISTELPLPAETAFALAQKPATFSYVVRGLFRVSGLPERADFGEGDELSGRIWWLGAIPSWRHHLRLVHVGPNELYTNERGGPVRVWNHRLTFTPLGDARCRYTDEIELDAGWQTPFVWLFAQLAFRYRQRRWRALARVLA